MQILGKVKVLRYLLFIPLVVEAQPPVFWQKEVELSGRVRSHSDKQPLEGVTVKCESLRDTTRLYALTDPKGYFLFKVKPGAYRLTVSFVGFRDTSFVVQVGDESKFVGNIDLRYSPEELPATQVTASAFKEEIDRQVIAVTDKLVEGTQSARQVLEKIPGIQYEPVNDNLLVDNNPNILLLVNGMEKDPQYIKNIAPERIARIEIIRNPVGRYGLEGYYAVINIILRDDYEGIEVGTGAALVNAFREFTNGYHLPFGFGYLTSTYTRGRLSIYGNFYSWRVSDRTLTTDTLWRLTDNSMWLQDVPKSSDAFNSTLEIFGYYASAGVDYRLTPVHLLSVEAGTYSQLQPTRTGRTLKTIDTRTNTLSYLTYTSTSFPSNWKAVVYYKGNVGNNTELRAQVRWGRSLTRSTTLYTDSSDTWVLDRNEKLLSVEDNFKGYIEAEHTLAPAWTLMGGYAASYVPATSTLTIRSNGAEIADTFSYNYFKNQAYAYLTWQVIKRKLSLRSGIALEHYLLRTPADTISFLVYQPAADLLYKPLPFIEAKLYYRMELNYPTLDQLNSLTRIVDRNTYVQGNPSLKPYGIHSGGLRLGAFGGRSYIEPYVRFSSKYIASTLSVMGDSLLLLTYSQDWKYLKSGLRFSLPVPAGKKFFALISFDIYRERLFRDTQKFAVSDFTGWCLLAYNIEAVKTSVGVFYANTISRRVTAMGWESSVRRMPDMLSVFVRKQLFNEMLEVNAFYTIPFEHLGINYRTGEYKSVASIERMSVSKHLFMYNTFGLRVFYSFNRGARIERRTEEQPDIPQGVPGMF